MWLRILICLIIGFLIPSIIDLIANKLGLSNKEKRCLETGIAVGILFLTTVSIIVFI